MKENLILVHFWSICLIKSLKLSDHHKNFVAHQIVLSTQNLENKLTNFDPKKNNFTVKILPIQSQKPKQGGNEKIIKKATHNAHTRKLLIEILLCQQIGTS